MQMRIIFTVLVAAYCSLCFSTPDSDLRKASQVQQSQNSAGKEETILLQTTLEDAASVTDIAIDEQTVDGSEVKRSGSSDDIKTIAIVAGTIAAVFVLVGWGIIKCMSQKDVDAIWRAARKPSMV